MATIKKIIFLLLLILPVYCVPLTSAEETAGFTLTETRFYIVVTYPTSQDQCYIDNGGISTIPVNVPYSIAPTVKPITASTSFSIGPEPGGTLTTTIVEVDALINPSDIDPSDVSFWSSVEQPLGVGCSSTSTKQGFSTTTDATSDVTTTAQATVTASSCGPYNCADCEEWIVYCIGECLDPIETEYYECPDGKKYYIKGGPPSKKTLGLGVGLGIPGFFFLAGSWENWRQFNLLATGQAARRGLPSFWMVFVIPCWFSGPSYQAKSASERNTLLSAWNSRPCSKKVALWISWGFRRKYPPFLGAEPRREKEFRGQRRR